jgi:thioredoxin-related protein
MTLRTGQPGASSFCAKPFGYAMILVAAMLTWGVAGSAENPDIVNMQQTSDLRQEAEITRARNLVLVLEFSREDCSYCRKLEELFLLPMQRNAHYDDKILIRSISLDVGETVIDFAGRLLATDQLATRYGVSMTPTLLFLNADGVEIGERLVGIWSEDFYGYFIDSRIDAARESL